MLQFSIKKPRDFADLSLLLHFPFLIDNSSPLPENDTSKHLGTDPGPEGGGTMLRPQMHLAAAGRLYPTAWRQADRFRADRGKSGLPAWPPWCYLPMAAWYAIVSEGQLPLPLEKVADVSRLAALGAWRVTQGVYRFDPTLYEAVSSTPLIGDLPAEILYRLPEWCVYIETPGMLDAQLCGVFAHLEWDANTGRHELRLLLDHEDGLIPMPVHIGAWPLEEAMRRVAAVAASEGGRAAPSMDGIASEIAPLLSLLLYLCSEAADYGGGGRPANPRAVKTAKGLRLFPPSGPRVWDVGARLGAALRRAYAETSESAELVTGVRARPRPHFRRAHWHAYWVGPGRQETRIHWLPPIPVNVEDFTDLPAVVRPVEK